MIRLATYIILLAAFLSVAGVAQESHDAKVDVIRLSDVTVTAQPTGKRHQSYVFVLKSKRDDSSWTFELAQDFGGSLLLHVCGNQIKLGQKQDLRNWHHKVTVLRLQHVEPQEARTGETITHKLLSFTWGQQDPTDAVNSDKN